MSKSRAMGWTAFFLALALAMLGVWRGEVRDVLLKAIGVCFECIGL